MAGWDFRLKFTLPSPIERKRRGRHRPVQAKHLPTEAGKNLPDPEISSDYLLVIHGVVGNVLPLHALVGVQR